MRRADKRFGENLYVFGAGERTSICACVYVRVSEGECGCMCVQVCVCGWWVGGWPKKG
jgi:hypothetical protein